MIVLKKVSKSFGRKKVLADVSFRINPKEFICITGPSGAGKTTLVHILAGAEEASSGSIEVDGVDLRSVPPMALRIFRQRVGIVFQDYKLLPHFTVYENIAFPMEVCGASNKQIKARTAELIKQMRLVKQADSLPEELSGGEKARAAIARAIVHKPMILLADEPTGNLDPSESQKILRLFKEIHKDGTTVVFATHDDALVDALQTRVIRLMDGKITRDSKGGYKKALATPKKAAPHHILGKEFEAKISPQKEEGDSKKKRKVRVTSVNT